MKQQLIDKQPLGEREVDEKLSFLPTLTYQERVKVFIALNLVGYVLQLGTLVWFLSSVILFNPIKFALMYSFGNLLSVTGTVILIGYKKQI